MIDSAKRKTDSEAGHALLIVLCMCMIMIIGTTVAMKVWSTVIQRDREDELISRGRQYAMALYLFRKGKGTLPTDLKQLEEKGEGGKYYLRRPYKDPITGQDFGVIMSGPNNMPIPDEPIDDPNLDGDDDGSTNGGSRGGFQPAGSVNNAPVMASNMGGTGGTKDSAFGTPSGIGGMPIMGVHSKSKALAIGPAKWRDLEKYNQWMFLVTDLTGQGQGVRPVTGGAPGGIGGPGGIGAQPGGNRGDTNPQSGGSPPGGVGGGRP